MINQALTDYIRQQSAQGISSENIKSGLLANGWTDSDIKEAYESLSAKSPNPGFNKKFIWVPALLLLVAGGGVLAFQLYTSTQIKTVLPIAEGDIPLPVSTEAVNVIPITTPEGPVPTTSVATPEAGVQDWKLYTSEFAGLSFEYPGNNKDIKVRSHAYSENLYSIEIIDTKSSAVYSIRTQLNTKYRNVEELITSPTENERLSLGVFEKNINNYSRILVGGHNAYKLNSPSSDNYINIYVRVGNTSYQIEARTLPTIPEDFTLESLQEANQNKPPLNPDDIIWKHMLSSLKFFPPVLTQQQKDMALARQDDALINALWGVSADLDNYCCRAGGIYPEYIPIRAVYPSSLEELYISEQEDGYDDYTKYKQSLKYSVSPDKKHFHLGILLNTPQLTEAKKSLGEDRDFNSKILGWVNGFSGIDPVFDMVDTR